ncbi:MAG: DUF503 domain-containing protein [Desulfarculales bacterium]|jgi:uncharacterized protein YlxP (DUF503 family)|nr:DUF503 domain-containing protein [Desulfarculales bacterium]
MVIGALKIVLHIGNSGDLKNKRKIARAIIDRVRSRFNAAAAEVGANELWQRLELGFAVCGNEITRVREQLSNIRRQIESLALADIVDVRMEIANFKDMSWSGEYETENFL